MDYEQMPRLMADLIDYDPTASSWIPNQRLPAVQIGYLAVKEPKGTSRVI